MLTAGVQKTRLTVLSVHRDTMPTCAALSNSGLDYVQWLFWLFFLVSGSLKPTFYFHWDFEDVQMVIFLFSFLIKLDCLRYFIIVTKLRSLAHFSENTRKPCSHRMLRYLTHVWSTDFLLESIVSIEPSYPRSWLHLPLYKVLRGLWSLMLTT